MKQSIEILEDGNVRVMQSIMPTDSKSWNTNEPDEKLHFSQISLVLTFDISRVKGNVDFDEVSPLLSNAMDAYFIQERTTLKKLAMVGMENKSNREKYNKMVGMVEGWEKDVIVLVPEKERTNKTAEVLIRERLLKVQMSDLKGMLERYKGEMDVDLLLEIYFEAGKIEASEWEGEKGKVEARFLEASNEVNNNV